MSTDYGLLCLDCNDSMIIDDERSGDQVADLILIAPRLAVLRAELPSIDIEIRFNYSRRIDLSWFELHGMHKLDVIDEYGGRFPRCEKKVKGPPPVYYCALKKGHDSDCSDIGVFGR